MRAVAIVSLVLAAGCSAQPHDIRSTITPEAIAASAEPLLFVELQETGHQAIMSLTGRNGDVMTWSTADGRSISLQDGVLVATRGFGYDLLSADVSGTLRAINGGPQSYERFASYLDGLNRVNFVSFACQMSGPTPNLIDSFGRSVTTLVWLENCSSLDRQIEVQFWRANDETWRSTQQTNSQLGQILTERLTGD